MSFIASGIMAGFVAAGVVAAYFRFMGTKKIVEPVIVNAAPVTFKVRSPIPRKFGLWTCSYCRADNDFDDEACSNCKSPRQIQGDQQ